MISKSSFSLLMISMSLLLAGCGSSSKPEAEIPGFKVDKSTLERQSRKLAPYSKIKASGHGDLHINIAADKTPDCNLSTNHKSISGVITSVEGDTLVIRFLPGINPDYLTMTLNNNTLTDLDLSGRFHANLDFKQIAQLNLKFTGASNVTAQGQVDKLDIHGSGAVNINARELACQAINATVDGASSVEISAQKAIDIEASGVSHITAHTGGKATITQHSNGASRVDIEN